MTSVDYFQQLMQMRDEERARLTNAVDMVEGSKQGWQISPLGKVKWLMHPKMDHISLRTLLVYEAEIEPLGHTGKEICQGGGVAYVMEGQGASEINGKRHNWRKGSVIQIPIIHNGSTHQHFNEGARPARLIFAWPNLTGPISVDMGSGYDVLEEASIYKAERNDGNDAISQPDRRDTSSS